VSTDNKGRLKLAAARAYWPTACIVKVRTC